MNLLAVPAAAAAADPSSPYVALPMPTGLAWAVSHLAGLPDADSRGTRLRDLGGPPADGSLLARADMATVHAFQRLRSTEGDAWARQMNADGPVTMWLRFAAAHRAEAGPAQGWLGTALLVAGLAGNAAVTAIGKQHWSRPRPFLVDTSIVPPFHGPSSSSYPSGHASSAYAAARIIAHLRPQLADAAYALARQVAASRVYAGVHFPSDVIAGAQLGTAIAVAALGATHQGAAEPELDLNAAYEAAGLA